MRDFFVIKYPEDKGRVYESFRYPGGEVQVRITDPEMRYAIFQSQEVFLFATITNGEVMELAQLISAIKSCFTSITLILPYLPYARADRSFVSGDCFGLNSFATILNSLQVRQVISLDVHSDISRSIIRNFRNVSPLPFIREACESIGCPAILLPDAGASRYGLVTDLVCSKKRDAATGKLSGFVVPSKEAFGSHKSVLIVDDICDGGRTFVGIAKELEGYDLDLFLYVTHGIFSAGLHELEKHFKGIFTTNSLPQARNSLIVYKCQGAILDTLINRQQLWKSLL